MTEREYIAVGINHEGMIWRGHFGMSPRYDIYDENGEMIDQRINPYAAGQGKTKHHDNPRLIVDLLPDCRVFIARRMGDSSKQQLIVNLGITPVITGEDSPKPAVDSYLASLEEGER